MMNNVLAGGHNPTSKTRSGRARPIRPPDGRWSLHPHTGFRIDRRSRSNVRPSPKYLVIADGMGSVVDEQMIIAVELQLVEAQHKALQDRLRLESNNTI